MRRGNHPELLVRLRDRSQTFRAMLADAGYSPLEVPVNYVSRGFDEGKKIDFWRDAFGSYGAFFRYRVKRPPR